jgi:DNA-binding protein H-NS
MVAAGLTPQDLVAQLTKPARTPRTTLPIRYRYEGKEWSGMGRKPGWAIELGEKLEQFRVNE